MTRHRGTQTMTRIPVTALKGFLRESSPKLTARMIGPGRAPVKLTR